MKDGIEALEVIRTIYCQQLSSVLAELRGSGAKVIAEPVLRDQYGQPMFEGIHKLPMRADLWIEGSGLRRVDSDKQISFVGTAFSVGGTSVQLNSFCWDACDFVVSGKFETSMPEGLRLWFLENVDLNDKRSPDSSGLHHVVHFLSDPDLSSAGLTFQVDFGSGDLSAFHSLLDALSAEGAISIVVGN